MTPPDVVIAHGTDTAVLSGDKALALVDLVGCIRDATYAGWAVPLDDVERLRTAAHTRGWSLVEHEPGGST